MGTAHNRRRQLMWNILADATPNCATCPGRKLLPFPPPDPPAQEKKALGGDKSSRLQGWHPATWPARIAAALLLAAALWSPSTTSPLAELDAIAVSPLATLAAPGTFDHPISKYLSGCDPRFQSCPTPSGEQFDFASALENSI